MKVLIAADIFPPQIGGPATYAVTLANELTKQGIEVVVVSLNPNSDKSVVNCSLLIVHFKNKLLRYWQYYRLILRAGKSADVIYAMGPVNAGYPALKAARKLGKKFVVKVVGDYAWEQWQGKMSNVKCQMSNVTKRDFVSVDDFQNLKIGGKIRWSKKVERQVVRAADAVIVPSQYLKKIVVGWGAPEEKVKVIYNAVEFKDVPAAPKPPTEKWIVSAARLTPWKGMGTLIEIMPEIIKAIPSAKLKIVGDGPEFNNLRFKIEDLRLGDCVELTGSLSHDATLGYLKAADVFALNSGYEGLSHVLLEALHAGMPVLASNVGGNPEVVRIVRDKSKADLFSYNDKAEIQQKVLRLLSNFFEGAGSFEKFELPVVVMINQTKERLESVCAS